MLSRKKHFGCEGCSSTQEGCWQKNIACGQTEAEWLQQQKKWRKGNAASDENETVNKEITSLGCPYVSWTHFPLFLAFC